MTHPSRQQLQDFLDGRLDAATQQSVEAHVAQCDACCRVLQELPPDSLMRGVRSAETWIGEDDTQPGLGPAAPELTGIPPELTDHPRYRVLEQLGAGGMGVVYKAEHRLMERLVALKVMKRRIVDGPQAIQRFHQEVKAAARLSHRNIVAAFDAERAGDLHLLVMEYIDGEDLASIVRRRGALPILHACNYVMQAAQGLQHASDLGMVHRDIKPHNLMRTKKGTVKVLDFGLACLATGGEDARLTKAGVALGTADYIAPEQIEDARQVDVRADIYSLGCTLYYLLAGHPPFTQSSPTDKLIAHLGSQPKSLSSLRSEIPAELAQVIQGMMAKAPEERPASPREVVDQLTPFGKSSKRIAVADSTPAPPQEPPPSSSPVDFANSLPVEPALPRPIHRRRSSKPRPPAFSGTTIFAGVGAAALVAIAAWLWLSPPVTPPPPEPVAVNTAVPIPTETVPTVPEEVPTTDPRPLPVSNNRTPDSTADWDQLSNPIVPATNPPPGNEATESVTAPPDATPVDTGTPEVAVPPAIAPTPGDAAPRGPNTSGWLDLLPLVNTANDTVDGVWSKSNGELTVEPSRRARLMLPTEVPAEYDFEVEFTRHAGVHSVTFVFAAGSGQATYEIDAWEQHLAGIQNVRGLTMNDPRASSTRQALENGRRYRALVRVRRDHTACFLDGRRLAYHEGDGRDLTLHPWWELPRPGTIGVGAWQSRTTFHSIRIRPARD